MRRAVTAIVLLAPLCLAACVADAGLGPITPSNAQQTAQSAQLRAPRITVTDLGSLGGSVTNADAINSHGQVVGFSTTSSGASHAFLWSRATGMSDLGTLRGGFSTGEGINDAGEVVGRSDGTAFLWTAEDGMVDLGKLLAPPWLESTPRDINNLGQIVGSYGFSLSPFDTDPVTRAFTWSASTGPLNLGALDAVLTRFTRAWDVNNVGHVVGSSQSRLCTETVCGRAVLWTAPGVLTDLGSLSGSIFTLNVARGINDVGQVVGTSAGRAFLWNAGTGMTDLGPGEAYAINDAGHVVGESNGRAFLWTIATGMIELPAPAGATSRAHSINNRREIVGVAITGNVWKGMLWTVNFGPATAAEAIADLIAGVDALEKAGSLARAHGHVLRAHLAAAAKQVERGNSTATANVLRAFIHAVAVLVRTGRLTAAQGQELTDGAELALELLQT